MAEAAIAFEWLTTNLAQPASNSILLCKEALGALSADRNALRAKLIAAHARALQGLGSDEEAAKHARLAIELARQVGEPSTLCYVLELVLHMMPGPAHIGKRLSYAMEHLEHARATGDLERIFQGLGRQIYALVEAGEVAGVGKALDEQAELARQLRQPQYSYLATGFRSMLALLDGRFADAEQLALEILNLAQRLQLESAEGIFGMQMFVLRREQGRLHEVAPIVEMFVQEHSASSWRPGLALMYAELGLTDKARALFEQLALNDFNDIQPDGVWAASMTFLAEVCALLGDRQRSAVLYRLLSPYAGYAVVASEWACFGAGSRFLGQLAATMGQWPEAEAHFDQALSMNYRMAAKPWLARTQYQFAQMLLVRREPGDEERASTLLDDAMSVAQELGMRSLERQVAEARHQQAQ